VATPTLYGGCLRYGGYTAESADEWDEALSMLVEDEEVREHENYHVMVHVEQHHALDTQAMRWQDAYVAILSARQPSGVN
jgi:hypothetical protein